MVNYRYLRLSIKADVAIMQLDQQPGDDTVYVITAGRDSPACSFQIVNDHVNKHLLRSYYSRCHRSIRLAKSLLCCTSSQLVQAAVLAAQVVEECLWLQRVSCYC